MRVLPRLVSTAVVLGDALFGGVSAARAEVCARPTDALGYAGTKYAPDAPSSFDSEHVRVWYAVTGPHAVRPGTTRPDGVPDDVVVAAETSEAALAAFSAWGYRAPVPDTDTSCGSNGGDDRLDVYLVAFAAADGTTVADRCARLGLTTRCSSFVLAEARMDRRYPTATEGFRTVLPHELFHAVQNAYDAELDRFWAEGTAQWATKRLHPELDDLERHLPAFFAEPSRSLDTRPGGVTASYLYGAAIWPIFLTVRHGDDFVRLALDEESSRGGTSLSATGRVLEKAGSNLSDALVGFATWNASTGSRSSAESYPDAASYPTMNLGRYPEEANGILSGASSAYLSVHADRPAELSLECDPSRLVGVLVPVERGRAMVDRATRLPVHFEGEGIVVVVGITTNKSDAAYALSLKTLEFGPPKTQGPVEPAVLPGAPPVSSGCSSVPVRAGDRGAVSSAMVALGVLAFARRRTFNRAEGIDS
jgi:hypothetical protein